METVRTFVVNREGIGFFKAILESYEDVALLTVRNGGAGEIELIYPTDAQDVLSSIMADMQRFGIIFREIENV